MGMDYLNDEALRRRSYSEFKLTKTEEDSLKSIEVSITTKQIDSKNKKECVDYLVQLRSRIEEVRENEHAYEGDSNHNVEEYLKRIETLIQQLKKV